MELSDTEKALYEELVVWLAIRMTHVTAELPPERRRPCLDGVHTKGCIITTGFMSAFERACGVLRDSRIVRPLESDMSPKQDPGAWSFCFRIVFDIPEMREHLRQPVPSTAPDLAEVLRAFLAVATEFEGVPTRRSPFHIPEGFEQIFCLLANRGFVEPVDDDLVKWSQPVTPHMRAIYAWDEDGLPLDFKGYGARISNLW